MVGDAGILASLQNEAASRSSATGPGLLDAHVQACIDGPQSLSADAVGFVQSSVSLGLSFV